MAVNGRKQRRISGAACVFLWVICSWHAYRPPYQRHPPVAAALLTAGGRRGWGRISSSFATRRAVVSKIRKVRTLPSTHGFSIRTDQLSQSSHSSFCVCSKLLMASSSYEGSRRARKRKSAPATTKESTSDENNDADSSWLASDFERGDEGYYGEEEDSDVEAGNLHIPSGGISVSDVMEAAQQDRFVSSLIPIETLPEGSAAQIVTTSTTSGSLEPIRYLVALTSPDRNVTSAEFDSTSATTEYCLVDVPPYSPQLLEQIQSFVESYRGRLRLIVVTSRDGIHYDSASSVDYSTLVRKSDLHKWREVLASNDATSGVDIVTYRLDTPRDCRDIVTQVLDGYGPFALDDEDDDADGTNSRETQNRRQMPFVETGRPRTVQEWDYHVAQDVVRGKQAPPDDRETHGSDTTTDDPPDMMYTPEAIRNREVGKRLLAVYTPGHTYGSISYVFPDIGVCCSGFTIPAESSRSDGVDDNGDSAGAAGPVLDCRGYITTSRAGVAQQMESARTLVQQYGDRFEVVLPSRGDPVLWLPTSSTERKRVLLDLVRQFERIGTVYEELGITSASP